jgi:molybdenum-dependent DNA-binding transcriptional regulator ModE
MANLNLHHLRLFRVVALEGTLTGAAGRLNLSPSALSAQLRALEAAVGHDLFERRGRGLVLTEAGRIALDHAEAIFRTAEDLTATLAQARGGRRCCGWGRWPRCRAISRCGSWGPRWRGGMRRWRSGPGGRPICWLRWRRWRWMWC